MVSKGARIVAANLFAAVALFLAAYYTVRYYDPSIPAFAEGSSILAILFAVLAFGFSARLRAPAVAATLVAAGIIIQLPPVQAMVESGTVSFPGPILGVIFFCPILILGLLKTRGLTPQVRRVKTASGQYSVAISVMAMMAANQTSVDSWSRWAGWGGWWFFGFLFWLLPVAVLVLLVYFASRWLGAKNSPQRTTALSILEERYVKGEITREQFEQIRKDIS